MSEPIKFGPVKWAADGMTAWIRWDQEKGLCLRCTVVCAAGNHARVANERYDVDRWVHLDNLLVPPGDEHGYDPDFGTGSATD